MKRSLAMAAVVLVVSGCGENRSVPVDEIALSDLTGRWSNDSVTLRVNDAGDFVVLSAGDPDLTDPLLGGFVARDDTELIFVTGIGGQCPGQSGVYVAAIEAGTLSLSLVEDPCPSRVTWFQAPMTRVD